MVTDTVMDLMERPEFMFLMGFALVAVGLTGLQSPGNWALVNAPLIGQLTTILPDIVHQFLAALFAVAGVTQINEGLRGYGVGLY